jgi:hypothetical protein
MNVKTFADSRIASQSNTRRAWQTPSVTHVGPVSAVLRIGSTKVSTTTADPGDTRKTAGPES